MVKRHVSVPLCHGTKTFFFIVECRGQVKRHCPDSICQSERLELSKPLLYCLQHYLCCAAVSTVISSLAESLLTTSCISICVSTCKCICVAATASQLCHQSLQSLTFAHVNYQPPAVSNINKTFTENASLEDNHHNFPQLGLKGAEQKSQRGLNQPEFLADIMGIEAAVCHGQNPKGNGSLLDAVPPPLLNLQIKDIFTP